MDRDGAAGAGDVEVGAHVAPEIWAARRRGFALDPGRRARRADRSPIRDGPRTRRRVLHSGRGGPSARSGPPVRRLPAPGRSRRGRSARGRTPADRPRAARAQLRIATLEARLPPLATHKDAGGQRTPSGSANDRPAMRPYRSMTTRHGRATHVRPRPPSSGRPQAVRTSKPDPHRVRQHRGIEPGRNCSAARDSRAPRALGAVPRWGGLPDGDRRHRTGHLGAWGERLHRLQPALRRRASEPVIVATSSPIISQPASAYSRDKTVSLQITVPQDVAGTPDAKVRLYLALKGLKAAPIEDVPITSAVTLTVPVDLTKGRNDLSATATSFGTGSIGPLGRREITLGPGSPEGRHQVAQGRHVTLTDPNVTIRGYDGGRDRADSLAENSANGSWPAPTAATDGTFQVILAARARPERDPFRCNRPRRETRASPTSPSPRRDGPDGGESSPSVYRIWSGASN